MWGSNKYGTAKRIRESLSAVLAYAVQMEYLPHNPITEVRLERGDGTEDREIRPFSDDEFATMLDAQRSVNRPYADIVEFLRETGLRWGEMKALRVADVRSVPFPAVFVSRSKSDGYPEKQTKGRRSRTVPLLGLAADIVSARAAGKAPDAFLFRAPGGGELSGPNFTRDVHWAATAGTHRLHDLRHTAATSWLRDGIDIKTISVWLGHSTTQQTVNGTRTGCRPTATSLLSRRRSTRVDHEPQTAEDRDQRWTDVRPAARAGHPRRTWSRASGAQALPAGSRVLAFPSEAQCRPGVEPRIESSSVAPAA